MTPEQKFFTRITALASMCGFTLSPEVIALYDRNLSKLGYENLSHALDVVITNRKSRDPFPSIREIREIISPDADPEVEAIEAAGRIVQAVSRIGPYQCDKAREFIGELGWRVVEREGGWVNVCNVLTDENLGMLKAQWRQMAKSQYMRAKSGFESAPQLPQVENAKVLPFDVTKLLQDMPK